MEITIDAKHNYTVDGKSYPSVTRILQATGIAPDYSFVRPEYAEKGTEIHHLLEGQNLGLIDATDEPAVQTMVEWVKNWTKYSTECEVKLHSANYGYCGTADLILSTDDGCIIADYKTGKANKECVKWQLSMYANAYEEMTGGKVKELWVLENIGKPTHTEFAVERISGDSIQKLMECYNAGKKWGETTELIPADDMQDLETEIKAIDILTSHVKEIESRIAEYKERLYTAMKQHDIKSFESEGYRYTIKAGSEQQRVDSAKLKEKYPEVYAECVKTIKVKESLIIKAKEIKE